MVRVKPLKWQRREKHYNVAVDPNGKDRFAIIEYAGMREPFKVEFIGMETRYFKTFEDAKEACEKDYQEKIENLIES